MARRVKIAAVGVRPPTRSSSLLERGSAFELVLHHIDRELRQALASEPDLVLLPESCDRPLDLSAAEDDDWEARFANGIQTAMARVARDHGCLLAYGRGRRSLVVIERDGAVAGIHRQPGAEAPSFIACSVGMLACVLSDGLQNAKSLSRCREAKPELILFASRFPGGLLEQFWAFTQRAHLASAVLFRSDLRLPCRIVTPVGAVVAASTTAQTHARASINLDSAVVHLDENREKLLALQMRMPDGITVSDPGHLGAVLLSNEASGGTVGDLMAQAGIESIDQYFSRYLSVRERSLALDGRREGCR